MIRFALALTCLFWASSGFAQGLDGRAERLLEEQLSGPGRTVEITGFAGAVSTRASFERLTMADDQGVWLVLENAVLDWTASALLRGRLQVDELSAKRLEVLRTPVSEVDPVAASEASGFRLPDLPVVIDIGRATLEEISLGAPLLGTPARARFNGSAKLDSGGLSVNVQAVRLDGPGGRAAVTLEYAPETEALRVLADIREPAGGIAARALNIPGLPSVALLIDGTGVLDDFASTLALSTEGHERFAGRVTLAADGVGGRRFEADLSGDVRALLALDTQPFFGPETRISALGAALPDGGIRLDAFRVETTQLQVSGEGAFGADGAPQKLRVIGQVSGDLPGGAATLESADLNLSFDASVAPDWKFTVQSRSLEFPGGRVRSAEIQGTGVLQPGLAEPFNGQVTVSAEGLALDDPSIRQAVGEDVTLRTDLSLLEGGRFTLTGLQVQTAHLSARGDVLAEPTDGRLAMTANLVAQIPDIGALGPIVAPVQRGSADVQVDVFTEFPGGITRIAVNGRTAGLDIGQTALQPLLAPETRLDLRAERNETGTQIKAMSLENSALQVTGQGRLSSSDGAFDFTGVLWAPQALLAGLPDGALRVQGQATSLTTTPTARLEIAHDTGAAATVDARLANGLAVFDMDLSAPALTPFQALLGPVERGAVQARISGQADTRTGTMEARVEATTRELSIGLDQLLPLIEPETRLTATVRRSGKGDIHLDGVTLGNPELTARGNALITPAGPNRADLSATLANPQRFLAGLPEGGLRLVAHGTDLSARPRVQATLEHGTGTRIDADATLHTSTVVFDLDLASPSLEPFRALTGPVRGGSLSAKVTGRARLDTGAVTADLSARTSGLETNISRIAALLRPETTLNASLERTGDGTLLLRSANLANAQLDARGEARLDPDGLQTASVRASLANLGVIVPQVPGRLTLNGTISDNRITAELASATGAEARINGRIGLPGNAVDLTTAGRVPLALASPFIGARSLTGNAAFDLAVRGAPGLAAVSGQVTTGDLRFADPDLGIVLSPATARIDLSGGRAQITLQGALNDAPLEVRGGVGLGAPFQTDVNLSLRSLDYAYDDFARLNLSADLTLSGPAQQQLTVAGDVRLGRTEIRIPDGIGGADPMPPVRHVGAPAAVRRTLDRAGLLGPDSASGERGGFRIPLDLSVRALEPIFVRGRGLDAEFGGAFEIRGTVANPVPTGQFSLRRGRLSLLGRRLDLTRGEITATGGLIPDIDIVATANADDIVAQVALRGPADAPELVLTSQPELPQDEVLARVLFGRDVSSLSAFQVAQLVSSLAALTSGRPSLLDRSRRAFGVDDLDLRTDAATGQAELAIGNYITENIYSEVEIGAQGNTQINLNLDLTDNTRVRGSVNSEGGTGIGIFWERDY